MEELAGVGDVCYLELLAQSKYTSSQLLEWIYSLRNMRLMLVLAHNPGMPNVPHPYVAPKSATTHDSFETQVEHLKQITLRSNHDDAFPSEW